MENAEMIEILEGLIRDPDTNPTAKMHCDPQPDPDPRRRGRRPS